MLSILVFFVALLIMEFAFRAFSSVMMNYNMEMHKYAKKLKKPSETSGLTHEHIPASEAFLMGVDVKINKFGFRGPDLLEKKPEERRVMLVGSSITLGWGVPYENTFASLLQEKLNARNKGKIEVVNTGIGNYNTTMEAILFKKNIDIVKPDLVILHYFINDAELITSKANNPLVSHSYIAAFVYVRLKELMYNVNYKSRSIGDYYKDIYASDGWTRAENAILDIKNLCDARKIKFMVLIQPDLHDLHEGTDITKIYEKITAFAGTNHIPYLNLFPFFSEKFKDNPKSIWVSHEDSHPNATGHSVIADEVYNYIIKNPEISASVFK